MENPNDQSYNFDIRNFIKMFIYINATYMRIKLIVKNHIKSFSNAKF